ncbi:MAG: hypothetical protein DMF89_25340 [Acidobacteria bacterium]|nr:MAG: hypothetical protein DMF90_25195 [Acidobacteriota bacterium]PYR45293.1 MAG: hypothetical protein DMF89_25340 [Acidobacteriota bacterium]
MVPEKQLFIVVRRYGPPYDAERALEAQSEWEAHRVFMNALEAEGIVRLGGPLEGAGEVLLVFRAAEAEEIEQWLANDPWTRSGILSTTRIVPWNLRIGKIA